MADVQLQKSVGLGRIGQRETALFAILEQDVDVLAGHELQAFIGRQAKVHLDDVRRQFLQLLDARGQRLDWNVAG